MKLRYPAALAIVGCYLLVLSSCAGTWSTQRAGRAGDREATRAV